MVRVTATVEKHNSHMTDLDGGHEREELLWCFT
jgi:hypothetical protein